MITGRRRFTPRTAFTNVRRRVLFGHLHISVHTSGKLVTYDATACNIAYTVMFYVLLAERHQNINRRHTLRHVHVIYVTENNK